MNVKELEQLALSDGDAAMAMAERTMLGYECKADLKAAYGFVQQAARLGLEDGRRAWVYLSAAGVGCKADPERAKQMLRELGREDHFAAVQHAFLQHLTSEKKLAEVVPEIISADPYIAIHRGLFSEAECRYLMMLGTPWLQQAAVLGLDGQPRMDNVRDANCATIVNLAEDLVVQAVNRTIAAATDTKAGWGEPLNILQYAPGQQYKPHHDGTGSDNVSVRNLTALIWLNDQYEGGETDFPKVEVRVRGKVGDMLVFRNTRDDGSFDERMIYAGLPVTSGVKWMASRWIRGADYLRDGIRA
ncbi:MAG: 2OG-Fe(II) oxygenase [Sphingomicrobium sp.]